jgi:hypothetical protein
MRRVGNDAVVPEERVRVLHRRQVGCEREWTTMKRVSMSVSGSKGWSRSSNTTVHGMPPEGLVFLKQSINRERPREREGLSGLTWMPVGPVEGDETARRYPSPKRRSFKESLGPFNPGSERRVKVR